MSTARSSWLLAVGFLGCSLAAIPALSIGAGVGVLRRLSWEVG